jgi:hypothetical protein
MNLFKNVVILLVLIIFNSKAFSQTHLVTVDGDVMAAMGSFVRTTQTYSSDAAWSDRSDKTETKYAFALNYSYLIMPHLYLRAAFSRAFTTNNSGHKDAKDVDMINSTYLIGAQYWFGRLTRSFYTGIMIGKHYVDLSDGLDDYADENNLLKFDFGKRFSLHRIRLRNVFYSPGLTYLMKTYDGDSGEAEVGGLSNNVKSVFESSTQIALHLIRFDIIF